MATVGISYVDALMCYAGIPMIMSSSETLKTEIVSNTKDELSFKLQQKYKPKLLPGKAVNSLITLTFDDKGKVKYHKVCQSPL